MKLYVNVPTATPNALARIALEMTGQPCEVVVANEEFRKTPGFKALTTIENKFPLLVTSEGNLHESTAIAKYFCTLAGDKFLGANATERSQVDQWIAFGNSACVTDNKTVAKGIFGTEEVTQNEWNDAAKNVKNTFKTVNAALEGKKWLVGNEMTIADVALAMAFSLSLQTILDGGFRKAMKNATTWAESVFSHAAVVKVLGAQHMCAKALKPVVKVEKKEVKKVAAPVKKEEKKVEKKLDNVESLPPTPFNLYDFKTFFVNHADKAGAAVDEWYKMLDWEGWAFQHLHYDKYEGEGEVLHVTNNLLTGFLSRAEHTNKYCFGRMGVFGEEPNLEIKGVWLMRGLEIPDGLAKEHPQFEYYRTRKMDPRNNAADDKLVREYFSA